ALLLRRVAARRETRALALEWIEQHWDLLVKRLPETSVAMLPELASGFCEPARAEEVQTFFGDRSTRFPGGPLALQPAVEPRGLRHAFVTAQRDSAAAFLKRYAAAGATGTAKRAR